MKRLQVGPRLSYRCLPASPLSVHREAHSPGLTRSHRTLVPGATGAPATPRRSSQADLSIPTCLGEARQEVEHALGSNLNSLLCDLEQVRHPFKLGFTSCRMEIFAYLRG